MGRGEIPVKDGHKIIMKVGGDASVVVPAISYYFLSSGMIFTIDPMSKASIMIYDESFCGNVKRKMAERSVGEISAVMS